MNKWIKIDEIKPIAKNNCTALVLIDENDYIKLKMDDLVIDDIATDEVYNGRVYCYIKGLESDPVLVSLKNNQVTTAVRIVAPNGVVEWKDKDEIIIPKNDIIAWMPFPKSYKVNNEEN